MTKEFMKALSNLLVANMATYEAQFGPIDAGRTLIIAEQIEADNKAPKKAKAPGKKSN